MAVLHGQLLACGRGDGIAAVLILRDGPDVRIAVAGQFAVFQLHVRRGVVIPLIARGQRFPDRRGVNDVFAVLDRPLHRRLAGLQRIGKRRRVALRAVLDGLDREGGRLGDRQRLAVRLPGIAVVGGIPDLRSFRLAGKADRCASGEFTGSLRRRRRRNRRRRGRIHIFLLLRQLEELERVDICFVGIQAVAGKISAVVFQILHLVVENRFLALDVGAILRRFKRKRGIIAGHVHEADMRAIQIQILAVCRLERIARRVAANRHNGQLFCFGGQFCAGDNRICRNQLVLIFVYKQIVLCRQNLCFRRIVDHDLVIRRDRIRFDILVHHLVGPDGKGRRAVCHALLAGLDGVCRAHRDLHGIARGIRLAVGRVGERRAFRCAGKRDRVANGKICRLTGRQHSLAARRRRRRNTFLARYFIDSNILLSACIAGEKLRAPAVVTKRIASIFALRHDRRRAGRNADFPGSIIRQLFVCPQIVLIALITTLRFGLAGRIQISRSPGIERKRPFLCTGFQRQNLYIITAAQRRTSFRNSNRLAVVALLVRAERHFRIFCRDHDLIAGLELRRIGHKLCAHARSRLCHGGQRQNRKDHDQGQEHCETAHCPFPHVDFPPDFIFSVYIFAWDHLSAPGGIFSDTIWSIRPIKSWNTLSILRTLSN